MSTLHRGPQQSEHFIGHDIQESLEPIPLPDSSATVVRQLLKTLNAMSKILTVSVSELF